LEQLSPVQVLVPHVVPLQVLAQVLWQVFPLQVPKQVLEQVLPQVFTQVLLLHCVGEQVEEQVFVPAVAISGTGQRGRPVGMSSSWFDSTTPSSRAMVCSNEALNNGEAFTSALGWASGVSVVPLSIHEIRHGAYNRALEARRLIEEECGPVDFSIGLEGGGVYFK